MKAILIACVLLGLTAQSYADDDFLGDFELAEQPRTISFNNTGTSGALVLLGAVILLGVVGILAIMSFGDPTSSFFNRNDYPYGNESPHGHYAGYDAYGHYRSPSNSYGIRIVEAIDRLRSVWG